MTVDWKDLTDEIVRRASFIEAIDQQTQFAFRIWCTGTFGKEQPIEKLNVRMSSTEFGELKARVRSIKGCMPGLVESVRL